MGVYALDGTQLPTIYGTDGSEVINGYDVNGNIIHPIGPTILKVMTFNVQAFSGMNSQADMMADIFGTYDADIIGFQECVSGLSNIPSAIRSSLSDYPNTFFSSHYNYNAVFSKIALQNTVSQDYNTQDTAEVSNWGETRCYIKCYLNVGGKTVCWLNTHLCVTTASSKYDQMAELFALAEQEEYCILTGDFNQHSTQTSDVGWQNMYKRFVDAGYNLANCKDDNHYVWTFSPKTTATGLDDTSAFYAPNAPDNIITSSNITFNNIVFDEIKLEYLDGNTIDHVGMVAELQIN